MALIDSAWDNTSKNSIIDGIKASLISVNFVSVSDSGTDSSRVLILSKTGFPHHIQFYWVNSYLAVALLHTDGSTILVSGYSTNHTYSGITGYSLVNYNNTVALFISAATSNVQYFMFTKAGSDYIMCTKHSTYAYSRSCCNDGNAIGAAAYAPYTTSRTTSGKDIIYPVYFLDSTGLKYCDQYADDVFSCGTTLGLTGAKYTGNNKGYLVGTLFGVSCEYGLIRYI